jgi:hypothetical protein
MSCTLVAATDVDRLGSTVDALAVAIKLKKVRAINSFFIVINVCSFN